MDRPVILLRDRREAEIALRAAAATGRPIALLSVPDAALNAGIGWFDAVMRFARAAVPDADAIGLIDCADRPDLVQAAFHQGIEGAVFHGRKAVFDKLADIAAQSGRLLLRSRPPALALPEHLPGAKPQAETSDAADLAWLRGQLK
ncbi:MAG: hypothetical protein SGJ07_15575 [Rhodospirillaceae bacterium]|nr:hypothetical protein [Rhodospirillaceae bacterium]